MNPSVRRILVWYKDCKMLNKTCIYHKSCSEYTLQFLKSSSSISSTILKVYRRIKGCQVTQVVTSSSNQWCIINGHGEQVHQNEMSSDALRVYGEVNKERPISKLQS